MPASKAQQAEAARKRRDAIQLRLAGLPWDEIADRTGYADAGSACSAVTEALKKNQRELGAAAEELRDVLVARLERMIVAHFPRALGGDTKSAELVRKCNADIAKLVGAGAPEKVEHSGEVTTYRIVGMDPGEIA